MTKGNDILNKAQFRDLMGLWDNNSSLLIVDRIFLSIEDKQNGVTFRAFIQYLNYLLNGTPEQKSQLCFNLIDVKKRGYFNIEDLNNLIYSVLQANCSYESNSEVNYRADKISNYLFKQFDQSNKSQVT